MKSDDYIKILNSGLVSKIFEAIQSDHIPTTKKEIDALCDIARYSNAQIQSKVFDIAKRVDRILAAPLLTILASQSVEDRVRKNALNEILQLEHPLRGQLLLRCVNDQNPVIQQEALKGLQGWDDGIAINILIDRIQVPQLVISPSERDAHAENIRIAAIEGVKTEGALGAVDSLIETFIKTYPNHRDKFIGSLITIGGKQLINKSLDAAEGLMQYQENKPGLEIKTDISEIISRVNQSLITPQNKVRYRKLISEILVFAITNSFGGWKYILKDSVNYLDVPILEALIIAFKKTRQSQQAAEIVKSFEQSKLKESSLFWVAVFDNLSPHFEEKAREYLIKTASVNIKIFLEFLVNSLKTPGGRHSPNAFPLVVKELCKNYSVSIAASVTPLLDEHESRNFINNYLSAILDGVENEDDRRLAIEEIISAGIFTDEAVDHLSLYFSQRIMEKNKEVDIVAGSLYKVWEKSDANNRKRIETLSRMMCSRLKNEKIWVEALLKKLPTHANAPLWTLIMMMLDHIVDSVVLQETQNRLNYAWNQRLADFLYQKNKNLILRHAINKIDDNNLQENERVWIIKKIGELGSISEIAILKNVIDKNSEICAVEAVKSMAVISVDESQDALKDALYSRKPGVVRASLDYLQEISTIKEDTIKALLDRIDDRVAEVRDQAKRTFDSLRSKHIEKIPSVEVEEPSFRLWLETLATFGAGNEGGEVFEKLLTSLGDKEAPGKRLALANTIASCCLPDKGVELIERELVKERKPEVTLAWENALDTLKGFPDRSIFRILAEVCGENLDQKTLLGQYKLEDVFTDPENTLSHFRDRLARANRVKEDPDVLVTTLDATAELLVDEILISAKDDPRKYGNQYGNKIGVLKNVSLNSSRHAQTLHSIRETAIDPHAKDSSGKARKGVALDEVDDAKKAFVRLFKETIKTLIEAKMVK